jgi:hypothetical protein
MKPSSGVRQQVPLFLLFVFPAGFVVLPKAFRTAGTSPDTCRLSHNGSRILEFHSKAQVT